MGGIYGCGCKEVYRLPHITYLYYFCICSFLQQHPYFLFIFKNVFRSCSITYILHAHTILFKRLLHCFSVYMLHFLLLCYIVTVSHFSSVHTAIFNPLSLLHCKLKKALK